MGRRRGLSASALVLVFGTVLSGCTVWPAASLSVDDAKREAIAFLEQTVREEAHVAWPATPDPIATRCAGGDGVRFQYLVAASTKKGSDLAESLGTYWTSAGLEVVRSQEDFGDHGVMYSATARADEKPWGSYEISRSGINLYIESRCAAGDIRDFE